MGRLDKDSLQKISLAFIGPGAAAMIAGLVNASVWWVNWAGGVLLLIGVLIFFYATLFMKNPSAISEADIKRNADIISKFSNYINLGKAIQSEFIQSNNSEKIKLDEEVWTRDVKAYIEGNIGLGQAIKFETIEANAWDGLPNGRNVVGGGYWARILAKNKYLAELLSALPLK